MAGSSTGRWGPTARAYRSSGSLVNVVPWTYVNAAAWLSHRFDDGLAAVAHVHDDGATRSVQIGAALRIPDGRALGPRRDGQPAAQNPLEDSPGRRARLARSLGDAHTEIVLRADVEARRAGGGRRAEGAAGGRQRASAGHLALKQAPGKFPRPSLAVGRARSAPVWRRAEPRRLPGASGAHARSAGPPALDRTAASFAAPRIE